MEQLDEFPTTPQPPAPCLPKLIQWLLIAILVLLLVIPLIILIPCFIVRACFLKCKRETDDRAIQSTTSETAEGVCSARAMLHDAGVIRDPYAVYFLSPLIRLIPMINTPFRWITSSPAYDMENTGLIGFVLGRTIMGQDAITNAVNRGYKNIVLLGAGYDTKFHRCAIPTDVKLFEVDSAPTQASKLEILEKLKKNPKTPINKHVVYTSVDFNIENFMDKLEESGFDGSLPTLFLWEGVTYYLDPQAVTSTLNLIHDRVPVADIYLDIFREFNDANCKLHNGHPKKMKKRVERMGEPFRFGLEPDQVEDFFQRHGFEIIACKRPADIESQYARHDDGSVWEKINPMGSLLYLRSTA